MDLRKVQKTGNGAYYATLPIEACREIGISPGTYMRADSIDGKIVLTPIREALQ